MLQKHIDEFNSLLLHRYIGALICFGAGAFSALSMAPANLFPVLFITLPILYLAISSAHSKRGAFMRGWLFGFGYFVFSLSWVGNALLVEGNPYIWAWPLAVSGLPALLAFFPAFACLCAKRFLNLKTTWGVIGFACFYALFEWLRGHIFTGFPWNLFGYTWADMLPVIQVLRGSDVYFLTWLTLLWALTPLTFVVPQISKRYALGMPAIFILCLGGGLWSLSATPQDNDTVQIVLVQPNINQADKWAGEKMYTHFEKHIALSRNTGQSDKPALIIWPETALSYRVFELPQAKAMLRDLLSSYPAGSSLITGMLRYDRDNKVYANALVEIDASAEIINSYSKHHLVPFGEYIPFQNYIPLKPVTAFQGFEKGEGVENIETSSGTKISPLICYEILFPDKVGDALIQDSDVIINITNDAWYGRSAGPHQHLTKAVFRAVETGLPVIRAANTGISAIINPTGQIKVQTALFEDARITGVLETKRILSARLFGYKYIFPIVFILIFIALSVCKSQRRIQEGC